MRILGSIVDGMITLAVLFFGAIAFVIWLVVTNFKYIALALAIAFAAIFAVAAAVLVLERILRLIPLRHAQSLSEKIRSLANIADPNTDFDTSIKDVQSPSSVFLSTERLTFSFDEKRAMLEFRNQNPWVKFDIPPQLFQVFLAACESIIDKTGQSPTSSDQAILLRRISQRYIWDGKPI